MLKRLLLPLVAAALALMPAAASQAAVAPHVTVTYPSSGVPAGGFTVTATQNANGAGCTGPTVIVYGSSAIASFVQQAAKDYCQYQLTGTFTGFPNITPVAAGSAVDVEYVSGGDSCPGDQFAAEDTVGDPILGVSDVFAPACTYTGIPGGAGVTNDVQNQGSAGVAVNIVNAITHCPGAAVPQGGAPAALATSGAQCTGRAPLSASGCPAFANNFAPNDNYSVNTSQLIWQNAIGDWGQVQGCPGFGAVPQQRINTSGTAITWCDAIYGPGGISSCVNGTGAGPAATTTVMLNDVVGNVFTSAAPIDGDGTIGYSSRAGIYLDGRTPSGAKKTVQNMGIVALGGQNGWNGTCDATLVRGGGQPNAGVNSEDNIATCNGDLQVVNGNYVAFGYEHLVTHTGTVPSSTQGFLNFTIAAPYDIKYQAFGFMQKCQMQVARAIDGGPLSATAGASC